MSPSLIGNYIDLIIILILIYFAIEAIRVGFWVILADFIAFLGSLLISLRAYKLMATLLRNYIALPISVANALGFLIVAIVTEGILGYFLGHLIARLPDKIFKSKHKSSKLLAVIPALGEALVLIAFILTLTLGLPIKPAIKKDITDSKLGSAILNKTTRVEKAINEVFGGVIEDSLTYLVVKPGSKESIPLEVESLTLAADEASEASMFNLVNEERRKQGVNELSWNSDVVVVARSHAKDMWERRYFGHVSPDGEDVGDRLEKDGIKYAIAGENLALAPTVTTAQNGLMNSEGHRANILEPKFKKVGIGVIDNGVYGKMFVQVFTD